MVSYHYKTPPEHRISQVHYEALVITLLSLPIAPVPEVLMVALLKILISRPGKLVCPRCRTLHTTFV